MQSTNRQHSSEYSRDRRRGLGTKSLTNLWSSWLGAHDLCYEYITTPAASDFRFTRSHWSFGCKIMHYFSNIPSVQIWLTNMIEVQIMYLLLLVFLILFTKDTVAWDARNLKQLMVCITLSGFSLRQKPLCYIKELSG